VTGVQTCALPICGAQTSKVPKVVEKVRFLSLLCTYIIKKIQQIIKKKKCKISFIKNRVGDVPALVCSYKKANSTIKWKPKNSSLDKIIKDEILWQTKYHKKVRKFIY
jgi:dTDP-D-glucose 4,6-dehydratase